MLKAAVLTASCFLTFSLSGLNLWASYGTTTASFLEIPVGAAPAALGGAYAAVATDAYAPNYNPSGVAFLTSPQLAGMHLSYLESVDYEYLSFVSPVNSRLRSYGALGASVQYLSAGDIPRTDQFGTESGDYSGHYASYNLAYGFALSQRWGIGVTGKTIRANLDDVTGNAFAADFGTLFKMTPHWNVAATLTDAGEHVTFLNTGDSLPTTFHIGTAFQPISRGLVSLEGAFPAHASASFHAGLQFQPVELIRLRAGYRSDTRNGVPGISGFSGGAGLALWGQELSYAWIPYGDLGDTHYFSFLFKFSSAGRVRRDHGESRAIQ